MLVLRVSCTAQFVQLTFLEVWASVEKCFCPQADLEIGVLGHREMLLSAIKSLPKLKARSSLAPRQPTLPAQDPSESPVLKAKQHRQKLLKELEKAEIHTASLYRFTLVLSHPFSTLIPAYHDLMISSRKEHFFLTMCCL